VTVLGATACVIRTTRARDATLHYHPTLDELRAAPRRAELPPPPRTATADGNVRVEAFVPAYPQPIGLDYDGAGAGRKVVGVELANQIHADRTLTALLSGGPT